MKIVSDNENQLVINSNDQTFEIYKNAIINILATGDNPDPNMSILGFILDEELNEDGLLHVLDLDKNESWIPLNRIEMYPPYELLVLLNRHQMIQGVIQGHLDPDFNSLI